MSIKAESQISVYEVAGAKLGIGDNRTVSVKSHWNINAFVVIEFEGCKFTVSASDLHRAITNATNWSH